MEDLKQIQEFFSKPLDEVMSLDDEAKAYYLAKVKSGEIDTLPENPKAAFLAQMTKDQMDHDKETLRRERGLEEDIQSELDKWEGRLYDLENMTKSSNNPDPIKQKKAIERVKKKIASLKKKSEIKPLNENAFVEAFKLQKALKGMGYDVKVKYLDDFGKDVFEIYFNNPADADESVFYDAKKLGYDNVRVFANPQEATKEEENEFHKKLDKLVHKTFGHSSDEKKKMNEASKGALNYFNDLKYYYQKAFRYLDVEEREEYKQLAKDFFSNLQIDNKVRPVGLEENALGFNDSRLSSDQHVELDYAVRGDSAYTFGNDPYADDQLRYKYAVKMGFLEEYNSGIYYNPTKDSMRPKAKEASKTSLEKVKDMIQKIMKEELSDYEEEGADYDKMYSDYLYKMVKEVATEKGYSKFLVSKDNPKGETSGLDTKTMNKILMNVIKDIDETIKLGKNLNEELCPKGKAYIKKRKAAGEKSSAYLSGRAVKVCKGQMKG